MADGIKLAEAYVQIIPSTKGMKGSLTEALGGEASSAGDVAGFSIASAIKNAIITAGIGTVLKESILEGADLQQSLGGIETLFKDSSDKVIESAKNAYMTAGMSANEYMETVTSFSASLLQGLAGDTSKAADVADMALTDMSDNANKMGTSMELIQNAYQGFAKQNYTMLDNLKLGYGGTKGEMQRLLKDAQKLTGVKYDLDNLADVYEAIHVIQEEMGITGTTAKEAASTFSGSLASMKAAWSNLLGEMALGGDIRDEMNALSETVFTFVAKNMLPMLGNVLKSLPDLFEDAFSMAIQGLNMISNNAGEFVAMGIELVSKIGIGIASALPYLAEAAINIIKSLGEAIVTTDWLAIATDIITQLGDSIAIAAGEILGVDTSMIDAFTTSVVDELPFVFEGISSAFATLWELCKVAWEEYGQPIWNGIVEAIKYVSDNWAEISATVSERFTLLWNTCKSAWEEFGQPIFDTVCMVLEELAGVFATKMPEIFAFVQQAFNDIRTAWENHLKPAFEAIGTFLNTVLLPAFEYVFKAVIEPLIDYVFAQISNAWNNFLKPVFNAICDFITGVFTGNWKQMGENIEQIIKSLWEYVKTAFDNVKNFICDIWNNIKDDATKLWNDVKSGITAKVTQIENTVKNTFERIKNSIANKIEGAKDTVKNAIDKIKGFFDFSWNLPSLKLPHPWISGKFSLDPPSVPSFGISWYSKAMNDPIIMNSPTAFGINNLGQIMAGGEAGSEIVSGTATLMRMIAEVVASQNGEVAMTINEGFEKLMALLVHYFPQLANMQVIMDSGALVGAIVSEMDAALGEYADVKGV